MKRIQWALYLSILVFTIGVSSVLDIAAVQSNEFVLNLKYEKETTNWSGYNFDYSYDQFTFAIPLHVMTYPTVLASRTVDTFPLWVNNTDWWDLENVFLGSVNYSLSRSGNRYRLHHGSTSLYYDLTTGILVSFYINARTGTFPDYSGYTIDTEIVEGNLESLKSLITGSYLGFNIALLTGIFLEGAVIIWFIGNRRNKAEAGE